MIPKKIHYCWFGGKELPTMAKKCISSWKKYFPDYEIIEWNESNFDINLNDYTKEAYENKKFAFLTDVARLYIIYNYGGIYFDTDVEVINPFGNILDNKAFFGLESCGKMATGLGFGAEKNNFLVKEMLDDYKNKKFVEKGKMNLIPCPIINSKILIKNGFKLDDRVEIINGIAIYPSDYFNPKSGYGLDLKITNNTVSIHHFDGSWLSIEERKRANLRKKLQNKYSLKISSLLYNTIYIPFRIISKFKEKLNNK